MMLKRDLVRPDVDEVHVSNVVLYGHSDNVLYYDVEHKISVSNAELMDLLKKGIVLIHDTDVYYLPVMFKDDDGTTKVTVATAISSGASTAKEYQGKDRSE